MGGKKNQSISTYPRKKIVEWEKNAMKDFEMKINLYLPSWIRPFLAMTQHCVSCNVHWISCNVIADMLQSK